MLKPRTLVVATLGAAFALPAAAQAHVTLQPTSAPADGYVVQAVRVPNEEDNASTTKVVVRFPAGIDYAAYQPVAGWKAAVQSSGKEVEQVTFAATGKGIAPGSFQDFPLQMHTPDKAGTALTFKALQTYSNGDVVPWIGAPDSDNPAPQVALTKAVPEGAAAHAETEAPTPTVSATPVRQTAAVTKGDGDGTGLAIAALAVGLVGLGVGGAGLAAARRKA